MTIKSIMRRILWAYPSAAGGVYVLVFKHGFHVKYDGRWNG